MTKCLSTFILLFAFYLICSFKCDVTYGLDEPFESASVENGSEADNWQGKWFPQPPSKRIDDNPSVEYHPSRSELHDDKHGIKMGIPNKDCDDAKTNLTVDWDNSPINFTCYEDKSAFLPNVDVHPIFYVDHIPEQYNAPHKCMDTPIFYEDIIPTFGTHRPLWPMYGEYKFLPKQRWLHNLEHGAVVMLYHPCANKGEVQLLRKLVTGCLYRHIITPYTLLTRDRPLALVTWGYRFEMSKIDPKLVLQFIRSTALRGPEQKYTDGQFDFAITNHAQVVYDEQDSVLCPNM